MITEKIHTTRKANSTPHLWGGVGLFILLLFLLTACEGESQRFKIDARFTQINQGEFYLYSPDEIIEGIDTVRLQNGRFTYSLNLNRPGILVLVFPNYSEQPIFAEPGKDVSIKGDVTHLREMKVNGTDENKLMNRLRDQLSTASPPEQLDYARQFIEDHPQSIIGTYLVGRYFLQGDSVNYDEAHRLINLMHESQPDNGYLVRLSKHTEHLAATEVGKRLPSFTTTDIHGKAVTSDELAKAPTAAIVTWASWNYESIALQRRINTELKARHDSLKILSLSLDGSLKTCISLARRDSLNSLIIVCDEQMQNGGLARQLGIYSHTENILLQKGRIVARNLTTEDLMKKLKHEP